MPTSPKTSILILGCLSLAVVAVTGCDTGPKLFPVEGQVTLDGKPLEYGAIRVIPGAGRTASSDLDAQGRFKLMMDDKEGCPPGTHIVTIASQKAINENLVRRYAPAKYDNGINSDLKITVDGPKKDVVIELKGDGKSYPIDGR
ncbi:hypothetical protein NA78x_001388 [Anatilimnocola sp. NA78]|uniref:hypothetical protein n=1 Tax=Anatilimnocola sp. NA78 TaxID=3415683 RepID=UPI003CE58E26